MPDFGGLTLTGNKLAPLNSGIGVYAIPGVLLESGACLSGKFGNRPQYESLSQPL